MCNEEKFKAQLLDTIQKLWTADDFKLNDRERNNKLREDILRRLISLVMTDDERAEYLGLPEGCRIRESAKIIDPTKLRCGKHVWIGEGAILDASGGLEVGDHTSIGLGVLIWTHSSHLTNLSMQNISGSPLIQRKPTKIGKGCFVGGPSVIYSGVTIGDRCLIQPMSVVTKDLPPYSIASGCPARVIKTLSEDSIERMIAAASA